jgi:hypothetical protein
MPKPRLICLVMLLLSLASEWTCAQIQRVGALRPSTTTSYGDIWAEGNYAYLGTRGSQGVFIIDISDPSHPFVASQYFPSSGRAPQDVKVQNGIGYFAMNSGGGGVDIVDLSDPTQPVFLSHLDTGSHNVFIDNNLLYTTSSSTATRVYDVSNPLNPTLWHSFDNGVHDMTVLGDRVYTSSFSAGTRIYDISNMSASEPPVELGRILTGSSSHSTWTTDDGNVLVNARERSGGDVGLFDIADISNPAVLARIFANDFAAENFTLPHNPLLVDDTLYVSWYGVGLQVFDVSNPSRPIHLGRYDTSSDWGVYPFLGPGQVLLSDINDGLIIVDVTDVLDSPQSDFDEDGGIDIRDIDLLVAAVNAGSSDPRFDLNTDSLVNMGDINDWLAIAGAANLQYSALFRVRPYLAGDANLDGDVDGLDFILWNENKFQSLTGWSNGDFNADGLVDGLDFVIWNSNKFTSSNPPSVPEPQSLGLTLALLFAAFRRRWDAS